MKKIIVLVLFFMFNILVAQTADELFVKANNLYKQGKYLAAIELYEQLETNENVSSELYYNLANAYYKLRKVAPTIYNYEKALQLDPSNKDAQNNLIIAKRLTLDRIEDLPLTFLQRINKNLLQKFTYDTWAVLVIMFSFLASSLFIVYYFSYTPSKKRVFFIASILSFILLIITFNITYFQYKQSKNNIQAIVFAQEVSVKSEPINETNELFILHEGTKVNIIDTVDNWHKIKLSNGKTGWIISKTIKLLHKL